MKNKNKKIYKYPNDCNSKDKNISDKTKKRKRKLNLLIKIF